MKPQFCTACGCVHDGICPPHETRPSGINGLRESYRLACEEIEKLPWCDENGWDT